MKKFIIFLITIFIGFTNVYASDISYSIENIYMNAEVDMIGSIKVTRVDVIKGTFNGYYFSVKYKDSSLEPWTPGKIDFRQSSFYNARAASLSSINAFKIDKSEIGWDLLDRTNNKYELVESANKGDKGVYTLETLDDGFEARVYSPTNNEYLAVKSVYYIDQALVMHDDAAELFYTFIGKEFEETIKNVDIQLTFPYENTQDKFRIWAHGPLNGEANPISVNKDSEGNYLYKGVLLHVEDVTPGTGVDIRVALDNASYENARTLLNESKESDALNKIIEVETVRANEANQARKEIKEKIYTAIILLSLYSVSLIVLWIHVYRKYDKEYKDTLQMKYYREFTGDYGVEVVEYLMNKNITTNGFSASIMNLIYKKNIEVVYTGDKEATLMRKSNDNLSPSEAIIMDLLFNKVSKDKSTVTLKQIKKYSSSYSTCETFMNSYNKWVNKVKKAGESENFYESYTKQRLLFGAYGALGVILSAAAIGTLNDSALALAAVIIFILSLIFTIYTCLFKKWTTKGRDHELKWKAFKNFLNDFGSFKDKEIPEIALWEKYLVYATVFGLAKKVSKDMKVYLTNMNYPDDRIPGYVYYNTNYGLSESISKTVSSSYSSSMSQINMKNATSSMSSGSGFGGGFSGGGSFGGGGGGGGAF